MKFSFSRLLFVCFLMLLVASPLLALPRQGGCSFECRQGVDASGQSFAHCVEYFFGSWSMAGCTETRNCYRMWVIGDDGVMRLVTECDPPSCYGSTCFMV